MGSMKNFEHYKVGRSDGDNYILPYAKLDFILQHNKIAIIEEEFETEYTAYQYMVKDGWELMISETVNRGPDDPKYVMKRVIGPGMYQNLKSIKKTYLDKYSRNPKQPLEPKYEN